MSHSVTSSNGMTVEVKDERVFINGIEIHPDRVKQARAARTLGMFMLIAGFVLGGFSSAVIVTAYHKEKISMNTELNQVLEALRTAIQDAEQFGMVRTEDGTVITGAVAAEDGIVLVKE